MTYVGSQPVVVTVGGGGPDGVQVNGVSEGDDVRSSVEEVIGSSASDDLNGDSGANTLFGNVGDDRLTGGGGNDRLDGSLGNDSLVVGPDSDVLIGGDGSDTILARDGQPDSVICGAGRDTATVDNMDTTSGCEFVLRPVGG